MTGYEIVSRRDGKYISKGMTKGIIIYSKQGLSLVLVYRPPRDPGSIADHGNNERYTLWMGMS